MISQHSNRNEANAQVPCKADLHCHSYYSDGSHSPSELLERARRQNLSHLAITDHDCTAAFSEVSSEPGLTLIPGVEISSDWNEHEIHVVGLGIEVAHPILVQLLSRQQDRRNQRLRAIGQKLEKIGIDGLADYLDALPCQARTRSHVAGFLVRRGVCKNQQQAFKRYLSRRGRAYVAADWCPLATAVEAIREAGGISVLAHPGRYPLSRLKLSSLLEDFRLAGGDAMETTYGNIDPLLQKRLQELALSHGLHQSQGSDFHSSEAHWTELGKFPALPWSGTKNAIWHHPRWHF